MPAQWSPPTGPTETRTRPNRGTHGCPRSGTRRHAARCRRRSSRFSGPSCDRGCLRIKRSVERASQDCAGRNRREPRSQQFSKLFKPSQNAVPRGIRTVTKLLALRRIIAANAGGQVLRRKERITVRKAHVHGPEVAVREVFAADGVVI